MLRPIRSSGLIVCLLAGCSEDIRTTVSFKTAPREHTSPDEVATIPAGATVPLFAGMGDYHRDISTPSSLAQQYFDQGMVWAYAFNHDEAIRNFEQVAALDPNCAMAWWGIALCNGPHINHAAMPDERSRAAWDALQQAMKLRENASQTEQQLLDALAQRYSWPVPDDRAPLNESYAEAMERLWQQYRDDPDIGTLYAEALLDLRPWDWWTLDGEPQPGTLRLLGVLEGVLAVAPNHPGANHLYIHAVESSPQFRKGMDAADRLRGLTPIVSHLLHMPTHIDVLVGQWENAVNQSELAIAADKQYLAHSPDQGFYARYMAHNHHMLAFACMMTGQSERALKAARDLVAGVPEELARSRPQVIDSKMPMVYEVLMRFGRWDEILSEPAPPDYLLLSTAIWHFSRGVAYAATEQMDRAHEERAAMNRIAASVEDDAKFENATAREVFQVADNVLGGEIAFHSEDYDEAIRLLRLAVRQTDRLTYDEPPVWLQPPRHALGAVLVALGRHQEAEAVYREDLDRWPGNGWSLYGLATSLREQGKKDEAEEVNGQFQRAWAQADAGIGASCLCVLAEDPEPE